MVTHEGITRVATNQVFDAWLASAVKQGKADPEIWNSYALFAIDPGETTGICWRAPWRPKELNLLQVKTSHIVEGYEALNVVMNESNLFHMPTIIITEDYKVYEWKATSHSWGALHTAQLIGAIKILAYNRVAPIHLQMAVDAKHFVTDEKLKAWDVYEPGMKHARDAQRHLLRFAFFGDLKKLRSQSA